MAPSYDPTDPRSRALIRPISPEGEGQSLYYGEIGDADEDGADISDARPPSAFAADDHYENLAASMDQNLLRALGARLVEHFDADQEARAKEISDISTGLELLGLTESDLDDGPFPGASTCTVPLILTAMVQFWARALPELFPPQGPVKATVVGARTEAKMARAERVQNHMNYQCVTEDPSYFDETSRLVWLLPFYGSMYRETYWGSVDDMLRGETLRPDEVVPDASATSFASSGRITVRRYTSASDIRRRQLAGEWIETQISLGTRPPDQRSEHEIEIQEVIDGVAPSAEFNEGMDDRLILHMYVDLDLEVAPHVDENGDPTGICLPFRVAIDHESQQILGIYRNWKPGDVLQRPRSRITQYSYLPGFGVHGMGLLKALGKLQAGATGSLRAILDGAATSSLGGGFMPKDAGIKEDRLTIEPGVYQRVDATYDDLQRAFYTPPFKEPSPQLTGALQFIIEMVQQFTATTEISTGSADNKAPVGTTVALIEQANKVYSAIHRTLHVAQSHEFAIRYELNQIHVPAVGYPYDVDGDEDGIIDDARQIAQADYAPGVTVLPVSDPNISSNVERIALGQALVELASTNPQLYNLYEAHKRLLTAMKVPDIDDVLREPGAVERRDPLSENQALLTQQGIKAFPDQDHQSHIAVHMSFLQNPAYGGHPEVAKVIMPLMQAHIAEHLAYLYAAQAAGLGIPAMPVAPEGEGREIDPIMEARIAAMAAQQAAALAQVPGLPPVPQQPDPAADQMRRDEEKHRQGLRHREEDHALKVRQAVEAATAKQGLETEKFINQQVDQQLQRDIAAGAKVMERISESE